MRALLLFRLCALSRRGYGSAARFSAHGVCSRALVRVRGRDALELLQGLVTNDVTLLGTGTEICIEAGTVAVSEPHIGTGTAAVYAHMLNLQGRTLYDVILYSLKESSASNENGDAVLLECDRSALDSVTRHLNTYRIRRRVAVEACSDLSLWVLLPTDPNGARPELTELDRALVLARDPRTALMGWRLVTSNRDKPDQIVAECRVGDDNEYHKHRYSIGVPEGVCDLPPGEALPLESNLVYLNGISFTKGCYLGQELTARTHHTGVVRKRLMPVRFSGPAHVQALALAPGAELQSPGGKAAGKHRGGMGEGGLSLVRLAHAGETLTARTGQGDVITVRANVPDWWPKQGAK